MYQHPLRTGIEILVVSSEYSTNDNIEEKIIEEYKKLNEKCDVIISKIKIRKNKK